VTPALSRFGSLLFLVLLVTVPSLARDRDWQSATFLGFSSSDGGTATMPVGTGSATVPIKNRNYWFRTEKVDYCLWMASRLSGRTPNLTIHGTTKIAVEGRHVRVLDDDGKDRKLTIVTKVARSQ
jgi:hypothetical protein